MNEARGVWWANYVDADGNKHSWTLRQEDNQSDADFIKRVRNFEKELGLAGYMSAAVQMPKAAPAQPAPKGSYETAVKTELKSVEVKSIALASGGEHPRWLVRGGPFVKFGITAWPEVLERAGIINQLDPMKENEPGGKWTAFYSEKTNDQGKLVPNRVENLEKVG